MKTVLLSACCLAGGLITSSCQDDPVNSEQGIVTTEAIDVVKGQYIVIFNDEAIPSGRVGEPQFTSRTAKAAYSRTNRNIVSKRIRSFLSRTKITTNKPDRIFTSAVSGFSAQLTEDEAQRMAQDPSVALVEPDRMIDLDYEVEAVYSREELENAPSINGRQTTTCATANAGGAGDGSGSEAFIWIVDTGIDLDHPDLNVVTNPDYAKAFAAGDSSPDDAIGHGTHVAGIAGAIANDAGILGISAGAPVVPVDVFGSTGSTPTSVIIEGMDHIAENDIVGDVVNMSLGPSQRTGCDENSAYRFALNRLSAQSRIALAAGNASDDAAFYDPGCQNLPNVYTVASMTCDGSFSSFSNFGSPIDWIATGSSVLSTYPGGGYATLSGTSMASPVVAGILHDRNGPPLSCGTVDFQGVSYQIACR